MPRTTQSSPTTRLSATSLPLADVVYVTDADVLALSWAPAGWLLTRQVAVTLRFRSTARQRPGAST